MLGFHAGPERTFLCTDARFDALLIGSILAVYENPAMDKVSVPSTRMQWLLLFLAAVSWVLTVAVRDACYRETLRYTMHGVTVFIVTYLAITTPERFWFRWLEHPLMRYIGQISFSLYVVHFMVLQAVVQCLPDTPRALQTLIGVTVCLPLAHVFYKRVELPCARLKGRLKSTA